MEPGSKQDGVVNMTRAMEALSPWLKNPRQTIIKVEGLVIAAAALLLLQLILGSCKRRWHDSTLVKFGLLMSTSVMNPLIIYTLGTMQSSPIKNSSYPVWAVFLIMASAGTAAIQQFDFYGTYFNKWIQVSVVYLQDAFYIIMFLLLTDPNTYTLKTAWDLKRHLKSSRASSQCVTALVIVVLVSKTMESLSVVSIYKLKRSLFTIRKKGRLTEIAERTEEESASDASESDSEQSMKSYKYIVCHRLPRFITIDQIWDSCGNSADGKALKDLCLSYALFWRLLRQRYFEEIFPETSLLKDHDFVFKKLLPSEGDFKRAFRIIKVELGFCYDFFFTKYHYTFMWMNVSLVSWVPFTQYLILLKLIVISIVLVFAIKRSLVLETPNPIIEVHISDADYIITVLVLFIAFIVKLVQKAAYLASNWAQVSLACMHVKKYWCAPNPFIVEKVIGFLRSFMISGQLRNKINQHSIIFRRQKQLGPVEVSDAVKRAVARSIISTYGNLGETPVSRQNQMFDEYSWALEDLSRVEVMLIWHIETEYCDISLPNPNNGTTRCNRHRGFADNLSRYCLHLFEYVQELLPNHKRCKITRGSHRGVAVHLSRYCTYLIRSVPELLPYHKPDIAELAKRVMEERKELFGSYGLPKIYNIMKNLEGTEEEDDTRKILQRGVKLGKQLKSKLDGDYWKLLEDFWAETIIHAAASHTTTKQHLQHLEKGGEFLTHIWALLSHAGVLNLKVTRIRTARLNPRTGP